jgi:hypothetical protein
MSTETFELKRNETKSSQFIRLKKNNLKINIELNNKSN